jgi:acyl-coenzyme A synthetase/AMP-(fatty) acid ligase
VLVGESLGKDPKHLGDFLAEKRIDVWYSAPSILSLLADYGRIDRPDFPAPRLVLFAGEVFPARPLKKLRALWPEAAMWNLYGPTETNVCTAYQVPQELPDDLSAPLPIGPVCPPLKARVVDEDGLDVPDGARGELLITGPGVMRGYFGRPDLTAPAFLESGGEAWYRTGDLVSEAPDGFIFHGRRDRMVKKRGYRIELGEIEAGLYKHPSINRAAVVAVATDDGTTIAAFVAPKADQTCSVLALKRHCAETLPAYMVPDTLKVLPALPETSTAKIDYPALKALAGG